MISREELTEILENVPRSYDDFVSGMRSILKDDEENTQKVVAFIRNNPEKNSSDVLEYLEELGI